MAVEDEAAAPRRQRLRKQIGDDEEDEIANAVQAAVAAATAEDVPMESADKKDEEQ